MKNFISKHSTIISVIVLTLTTLIPFLIGLMVGIPEINPYLNYLYIGICWFIGILALYYKKKLNMLKTISERINSFGPRRKFKAIKVIVQGIFIYGVCLLPLWYFAYTNPFNPGFVVFWMIFMCTLYWCYVNKADYYEEYAELYNICADINKEYEKELSLLRQKCIELGVSEEELDEIRKRTRH